MLRLSDRINDLAQLTRHQQKMAILERRQVIRESRDAKGDDRCHIDDWLIEDCLIDTPPRPHFTFRQLMTRCVSFYESCKSTEAPVNPPDAILDPERWNDDVFAPGANLLAILANLQKAIRRFRDQTAYSVRSIIDYRRLYAVLPEKLEADFRLPSIPEFLGVSKPNAGCPAFLASHANCGSACNMHVWGPCHEPVIIPVTALVHTTATPT